MDGSKNEKDNFNLSKDGWEIYRLVQSLYEITKGTLDIYPEEYKLYCKGRIDSLKCVIEIIKGIGENNDN